MLSTTLRNLGVCNPGVLKKRRRVSSSRSSITESRLRDSSSPCHASDRSAPQPSASLSIWIVRGTTPEPIESLATCVITSRHDCERTRASFSKPHASSQFQIWKPALFRDTANPHRPERIGAPIHSPERIKAPLSFEISRICLRRISLHLSSLRVGEQQRWMGDRNCHSVTCSTKPHCCYRVNNRRLLVGQIKGDAQRLRSGDGFSFDWIEHAHRKGLRRRHPLRQRTRVNK